MYVKHIQSRLQSGWGESRDGVTDS